VTPQVVSFPLISQERKKKKKLLPCSHLFEEKNTDSMELDLRGLSSIRPKEEF
jgi:hypothetical protein